ncbi:MAG: electron transfer flavoprotein subunit beta/FixA family protein [Bacteroidia bacterium]|nr:electron transfer flavoprotein subunit beta/FixA family protein [Bacteroidia bacterium]
MKILVCISHVPDTTTKIQFESDKTAINKSGVTFVINPYCEYGLSRALGFREEGKTVTSITAVCVGGPEVEPTLRKALAIGADHAVRIDAPTTDSAYVARQLAEYASGKDFAIIFTGKESIDFNGSLVPGMLAEYLGYNFVSYATAMSLTSAEMAEVHREVDGGEEVLDVKLPAVISCQKGIAEWRIASMRGIMGARNKPLAVIAPAEVPEAVATVKFEYPPAKVACQLFPADQPDQLVQALAAKGLI